MTEGERQDDCARGQMTRMEAEIKQLLDEAEYRMRRADRKVRFWSFFDVALGLPAAVLAAVSGAAGLASADARIPAAFLALGSAGFSAASGFLRSEVRLAASRRSRQAWAEVEAGARLIMTQASGLDNEAANEALRRLFDIRRAAMTTYTENTPTGRITS
ncbi:hypothetical protein [Kitasatospora sp. NPDC093806]|uniref:hypothetical protein n=1 Tax=Kitasatospora sp. NPDC093806 TaxID=3155075 RepID=UPI00341722B1